MVPLRDDIPTRITPYITYGLIGGNIVVFLYQLSLPVNELKNLLMTYGVVPAQLTAACQSGNYWPEALTLITSQFLHGGFFHLGGNMLFLWIFGNNVEEQLGHLKFLLFYLTCGALAALTQWWFSMQSNVPAIGASGAIAGVLGAYIIRFPYATVLTLIPIGFFITTVRIPALFFLGFWFLQQALLGIASLQVHTQIGMETGGIAYWAHAGGFVFGVLLGPPLGLFSSKNNR